MNYKHKSVKRQYIGLTQEKSTLHIVRRNNDRDVKLTVGGRLFHRFIKRYV